MKTLHYLVTVKIDEKTNPDVTPAKASRVIRDAVLLDLDYKGFHSAAVKRLWAQPDGIYSTFPNVNAAGEPQS